MSLLAIIIILVLLLGTGGSFVGPYAGAGGPYLGGGLGLVLVIVIILAVMGRI